MGRVALGVWVSDRWTPSSEEDGHGKNNKTPQLFIFIEIIHKIILYKFKYNQNIFQSIISIKIRNSFDCLSAAVVRTKAADLMHSSVCS